LATVFALVSHPIAAAQSSSAMIDGTVMDSSGAVVGNAQVSLTNSATGASLRTSTSSSGTFSILDIRPGQYALIVSKAGFAASMRAGLVLQVNQTSTVDFRLVPGSSSETITVTGRVSPVDSSTAELGTIVTERSISDLPSNGRNFTQLITLSPGVSPVSVGQNANRGGFAGNSIGAAIFPSINGQRNRSNMFMLDGVNDLAFLGNYNYAPILDEIQEFKVQSHNDLAEFGQVAGGIMNIATKGGTNLFHGSIWDYFRNEQLDARNYFLPTRNPLRQNQFGVAVNGPVRLGRLYDGSGKTFFSFAFEGFRQSQATQSVVLAPTTAELSGDFSALLNQGIQLYNPYSTRPDPSNPGQYLRDPFPNNDISQYLSPAAVLYARTLLPVGGASFSGGNLFDTTPTVTNQNSFSGRIDQNLGTHDILFGRISEFSQLSTGTAGFPGAENQLQLSGWNAALHESHIFGPHAILDLRLGRNLGSDVIVKGFPHAPPDFVNQLESVGFSSKYISNFSSISGSLIPLVSIPGYASTSGSNLQNVQTANTYEFGGDLTGIVGRHTLKTGYDYQTDGYYGPIVSAGEATTSFQTSNLENPLGPSGKGTGDPLASFLLGVPNSSYRRDDLEQLHGGSVQGAYLQDQLPLSSLWSLNMGVRYDVAIWPVYGYFKNGQGYVGDLDLSDGTYIVSGIPPPCSNSVGSPCVPGGVLPANVVLTPSSNHGIHVTDYTNWQARVGTVYRASERLSVDAAYGRFYDEWNALTQFAQNVGGNWPSVGSFNMNSQNSNIMTASIGDPLALGQGVLPQPSITPFLNASYYFNPRLKTPYADEWNLGLNFQLEKQTSLFLGYIGSHSGRLDKGGINNTAEYPGSGSAAAVAARRPYPYITPTKYDDSSGNSNYNALQTRLTRQNANGLAYLLSYTWSKSIDLGCSGSFGVEGCSIQNPYDPRADRSVSGFDVTNIFTGSASYDVPFGRGKRFHAGNPIVNFAVGGWQLNSIVSLGSGVPYYVTYSGVCKSEPHWKH
jgi:hypothetical protein